MEDLPIAKKSLGQHWLSDAASLRAICDAADIHARDTILEIGPGPGSLTILLLSKAAAVVAVEFDDALALELRTKLPAPNLEIVTEDILKFDLTTLPRDYKVVANIPYYLTSHLIRVLSESANPPSCAVLLVQKEVAERVAAQPGQMSLLAVTAQYYFQVSLGAVVPAKLFTPPPKVDSRILVLNHRVKPLFPAADARTFFRIVKAGFSQRRKTLLNSLSAGLQLSREATETMVRRAGVDPGMRAQALTLEQWQRLYKKYLTC